MKKSDEPEFKKIMAGLKDIFTPEKPLSTEKQTMYWTVFKDWTIEEFRQACNAVVRSKTISTFPLPAEIIEAGQGDKALQAWLSCRDIVAQFGHGNSMILHDPICHSVIEAMGGWDKFCICPDNERTWIQKEFERLYALFRDRKNHPLFLQGSYDLGVVMKKNGKYKRLNNVKVSEVLALEGSQTGMEHLINTVKGMLT